MDECQRAPHDHQTAVRAARESRNRALDLTGIAHIDRGQFNTERWGHGLDRAELANSRGYGGITYDGDSRQFRHHLFEQLQPFRANAVFEIDKAGRVAARPCQAIDETGADWIRDIHEHDWHRAGRLQ